MRSNRSPRSGFSLIEQVVAIASVAVVAAVVVPTVVNQLDKSEISRMESDLRALEKAAKDFRTDVSYWPGRLIQLKDPLSGTSALDAYGSAILPTVHSDWKGAYFEPKSFVNVTGAGEVMISAAGTFFSDSLYVESQAIGAGTSTEDSYLVLRLNNVSEEDARKLSQNIDSDTLHTAGRVQWTDGGTGKGTLRYYAGPIN